MYVGIIFHFPPTLALIFLINQVDFQLKVHFPDPRVLRAMYSGF